MTVSSAAPADLALLGIAGNPFSVLFNVTLQDNEGNPIAWSALTDPVVYVSSGPEEVEVLECTPELPDDGQLLLAWTAEQTAAMGTYPTSANLSALTAGSVLRWSLSVTINGTGPLTLCGGQLTMTSSTGPGTSSASSIDLTVTVGANPVNMSLTFEGGIGGGGIVSVFGRTTTAITAEAGDYSADQITGLPWKINTVVATAATTTLPSPTASPFYTAHLVTLDPGGGVTGAQVIEVPAASADLFVLIEVAQGTGNHPYSFIDPEGHTASSAATTTNEGQVDIYLFVCLDGENTQGVLLGALGGVSGGGGGGDEESGGGNTYTIYEVSGTYPLRDTATTDSSDTVIWIGIDAPTIGSGYAINNVDLWTPTSV